MSGEPDDLGITFGAGTTPPEVAEAMEMAALTNPRVHVAPTRSAVEQFFAAQAEEIKRAKAGGP